MAMARGRVGHVFHQDLQRKGQSSAVWYHPFQSNVLRTSQIDNPTGNWQNSIIITRSDRFISCLIVNVSLFPYCLVSSYPPRNGLTMSEKAFVETAASQGSVMQPSQGGAQRP